MGNSNSNSSPKGANRHQHSQSLQEPPKRSVTQHVRAPSQPVRRSATTMASPDPQGAQDAQGEDPGSSTGTGGGTAGGQAFKQLMEARYKKKASKTEEAGSKDHWRHLLGTAGTADDGNSSGSLRQSRRNIQDYWKDMQRIIGGGISDGAWNEELEYSFEGGGGSGGGGQLPDADAAVPGARSSPNASSALPAGASKPASASASASAPASASASASTLASPSGPADVEPVITRVRHDTVLLTHKENVSKTEQEKRQLKRSKVVEEIIASEALYAKFLGILITSFVVPTKPIIGEEKHEMLFSNLPSFAPFHDILSSELLKCNGDVSAVFSRYAAFLRMYMPYINNYETALHTLSKLKKDSAFSSFLAKQRANGDVGSLDLSSFLIMPIQRIPRYRLLLESLKKYTDESDPEMPRIHEALDIIKEVAEQVNESRRNLERLNRIMEVQNRLVGYFDVIEPWRVLIRESPLTLKKGSSRPVHVFLFNDILLWTSPSPDYQFKGKLNLAAASLEKLVHKRKIGFVLTSPEHKEGVIFVCESHEEREEWISLFAETIQEAKTARQELFERKHKRRIQLSQKIQDSLRGLADELVVKAALADAARDDDDDDDDDNDDDVGVGGGGHINKDESLRPPS